MPGDKELNTSEIKQCDKFYQTQEINCFLIASE